jgi:hypothetical protein
VTAAGAPKVFISYRRRDSGGHAGRLYDAMAGQFDEHNVFMDVDMAPGVDFVERITQAIGACHVLLVVMGPRWATLLDEEGNVRLGEAEDFVRLEVETALRRPDVTVIPVLVAGAQMPEPERLPEGLRPLVRRNALELSDMRWRFDVQRLSATLHELLSGTTGIHEVPPQPAPGGTARNRRWFQFLLEGVLVAIAAGLVARGLSLTLRTPPGATASDAAKIVDAAVWRGEIWAVVGAALAVWLTFMRGEPRDAVRRAVVGLVLGGLAGVLGGAFYAALRFLPDHVTPETVHVISTASYAITGAILGALVGALWIPRRLGVSLLTGLLAGGLVHAAYNNRGFTATTDGEKIASTSIECFVIVGAILATLLALDALTASSRARTGPPRASAGYG